MKFRDLLHFFSDGLVLINRNWDLLLLSLSLSTSSFLAIFFPTINNSGYFQAYSILELFFITAFGLSIPLFMVKTQQGKKRNAKEMLFVTLKSAKRIALPSILLFIGLVLLLIILAVAVIVLTSPSKEQMTTFFQNSPAFWYSLLGVIIIVLSTFEFTSFYFSLENQGLIKAMKSSFSSSLKNLPYLACIALILLFIFTLGFLSIGKPSLIRAIILVINQFLTFLCTAASLLYYQKVLKKAE